MNIIEVPCFVLDLCGVMFLIFVSIVYVWISEEILNSEHPLQEDQR